MERFEKFEEDENVPANLVINWDQTGVNMVPGGQWTLKFVGSKQVTIAGLDDKRQITVVLAATKDGNTFPPQVVNAGVTG